MKKKVLFIAVPVIIILLLISCSLNNTVKELTPTQQETIDRLWDNKHNWHEITGYVSGGGECNYVSFGECNGQTVFTAYHLSEESQSTGARTSSSNTYYIYPNTIVKMDSFEASQFALGGFSGQPWSQNSTKEDLERIYLDYLNNK
ncbi:MAG: hypothetical protein ACI4IR_03020 [Eubacterium sp.]